MALSCTVQILQKGAKNDLCKSRGAIVFLKAKVKSANYQIYHKKFMDSVQ
jgi:hypothetical protein